MKRNPFSTKFLQSIYFVYYVRIISSKLILYSALEECAVRISWQFNTIAT